MGGRAQEIRVLVRGEFDPDVIMVEAGRPVRLLFYRDETAARSERVVFERPQLSQTLTSFQTTTVEFTPEESAKGPRAGEVRLIEG